MIIGTNTLKIMTNKKEIKKNSKNHLVVWNYIVWKQTAPESEYKMNEDIHEKLNYVHNISFRSQRFPMSGTVGVLMG